MVLRGQGVLTVIRMIKKFLPVYLGLIFISQSQVFCQTQQGAILTSGSIRFSFDNVKEEINNDNTRLGTRTIVDFVPSAAYFVDDGVAVGALVDWERESFKDIDEDRQIFHSISAGPFIRYYTELGPFFQAFVTAGGGSFKEKPEIGDAEEFPFGLWSYGIGLGYPFFLGDMVSFEPLILFRSLNRNRETVSGDDQTFKYRGVMIRMGLAYYIFQ